MLNVPRCFNIRSLNQTSIWIAALGLYNITHRSIQTNTNKRKTLTVCPWNVLMGRSCPSLQTWIHMSVLQEANVLLLCQSTSSAGAVGRRRTERSVSTGRHYNRVKTSQHSVFCTWVEGKLLFGFSCMSVPNDCCLPGHTNMYSYRTSAWSIYSRATCNTGRVTHRVGWFTLSTPALRIKLPFLFHLRAKMGPLCWPSVLARFPVEHKHEHNL